MSIELAYELNKDYKLTENRVQKDNVILLPNGVPLFMFTGKRIGLKDGDRLITGILVVKHIRKSLYQSWFRYYVQINTQIGIQTKEIERYDTVRIMDKNSEPNHTAISNIKVY